MPDATPFITLCMIVKNEENYILECLTSTDGSVDEIVIADTGSTDRTVEIANSFPRARVYTTPWEDDYSKAKNFILSKATGRYVLFLDADERLDSKDLARLRQEISENPQIDAFRMPIRSYTLNATELGWQPQLDHYRDRFPYPGYVLTHLCRLFRKCEEIFYTGCVHELVEPQLQAMRKMVQDINIPIHHLGKIKEVIQKTFQSRYETYLQIHHKKIEQNPRSAKAFFELGINYLMLNDYQAAKRALNRSLQIDPFFPEAIKHLCIVLLKLREFKEVLSVVERSAPYYGADPDFLLFRGVAFLEQHQIAEAEKTLMMALQANPYLFPAIVSLTEIRILQNALPEAKELIARARQLNSNDEVLILNEARVLEKQGRLEPALRLLESLEAEIRMNPKPNLDLDKVLFEEAKLMIKLAQHERAKDKLTEAYTSNQRSAGLCIALATVYQYLNNLKQSQRFIERAAELDPTYEQLRQLWAKMSFG